MVVNANHGNVKPVIIYLIYTKYQTSNMAKNLSRVLIEATDAMVCSSRNIAKAVMNAAQIDNDAPGNGSGDDSKIQIESEKSKESKKSIVTALNSGSNESVAESIVEAIREVKCECKLKEINCCEKSRQI